MRLLTSKSPEAVGSTFMTSKSLLRAEKGIPIGVLPRRITLLR
jgi:hypothetical protein